MKKVLISIVVCLAWICSFAQLKVKNLRVEDRNGINTPGLDNPKPRFSWQLESDRKNILQTAYEIRVTDAISKKEIWNSGKVMSDQSLWVPFGGSLKSSRPYFFQVKVWDNQGKTSSSEEKGSWLTGLLSVTDWKAKWIETSSANDTVNGPAFLFRKPFLVDKKVLSATAFITAHGMYEASINGKRVGDAYLTPGWTSYHKRLQYQVYDVTSLLGKGENVIGVNVGSGWYRTPLAWTDNKNLFGKKIALLMQVNIIYADGTEEAIISNGNWKISDAGPIRFSEIYNGEVFDARNAIPEWNLAGFSDQSWASAVEKDYPLENLLATYNEPVTKHEVFHPVKMIVTPKGEHVYDFGQNLVGWAQFRIRGKSGDRITVDHAEVLDKEGNFYTDNLRAAKASNTYILNGKGEEFFEPHFTFQGFRYIRIRDFSGNIKPEDVTAVTLYSDMPATGQFSCSNPLLNQLQHNIQWGQKGNFLDVPTDCPQRDERLGWTGDAQAFSRTAAYNMGVHNFFAKWLKDVSADQSENGMIPFVVPNVLGPLAGASAGWADVSTIIPWNMWLAYGDRKILEDQYASMKAWVGYMESHSQDYLWNKGFHFGDWLFYRPADDNDGRSAVTDKYLIAQCFFAHSTQLVINAATVLNKTDDVQKYTRLLQQVKEAFMKEYSTGSGRLVSSTQTAYVLALQFDMLPENLRAQAADRLVKNVEDYDNHLTTGFLGTPYLCHVLSRYGYDTVAYKLLLQETYPSWLYPVKMGATTIWERWDGQKPDSSFQTPGMNSFNHYAYGAIGDWMYRNITGIDTYEEGPGYRKIRIQPHTGGGLNNANADLETGYGKISSHWKIADNKLMMDVTIPANTTARIFIPASKMEEVTENGKAITEQKEMKPAVEGKYVVAEVGSGTYHFSTPAPR